MYIKWQKAEFEETEQTLKTRLSCFYLVYVQLSRKKSFKSDCNYVFHFSPLSSLTLYLNLRVFPIFLCSCLYVTLNLAIFAILSTLFQFDQLGLSQQEMRQAKG